MEDTGKANMLRKIYESQLKNSYKKINENVKRLPSSGGKLQAAQDAADLASIGLAAGALGTAATGIGIPASPFLELGSSTIDLVNAATYGGRAIGSFTSGDYSTGMEHLGAAGLRTAAAIPYAGDIVQPVTATSAATRLGPKVATELGLGMMAKGSKAGPTLKTGESVADIATQLMKRRSAQKAGTQSTELAVTEIPWAKRIPRSGRPSGDESPVSGTKSIVRSGLEKVGRYGPSTIIATELARRAIQPENEAEILDYKGIPSSANVAQLPVGMFDPGQVSSYGRSIGKGSQDMDDRFTTPHFYRTPVSMATLFRRPVSEETISPSEKESPIYSKVKKYVSHYLKSQSGQLLKKRLEEIGEKNKLKRKQDS